MTRGGLLGAAAAGLLLASTAATAQAAPAVERGWPVRAPAGGLFVGPAGGVAVLSYDTSSVPRTFSMTAYGLRGKRLWTATGDENRGNCEGAFPSQPTTRLPDGGYGPISFTGGADYGVDRDGRVTIDVCTGAASIEGACTEWSLRPDLDVARGHFGGLIPVVTRRVGERVVWRHEESDHR